jgi:hypothetical protein
MCPSFASVTRHDRSIRLAILIFLYAGSLFQNSSHPRECHNLRFSSFANMKSFVVLAALYLCPTAHAVLECTSTWKQLSDDVQSAVARRAWSDSYNMTFMRTCFCAPKELDADIVVKNGTIVGKYSTVAAVLTMEELFALVYANCIYDSGCSDGSKADVCTVQYGALGEITSLYIVRNKTLTDSFKQYTVSNFVNTNTTNQSSDSSSAVPKAIPQVCGSPTDTCMNQTSYSQCLALSRGGCTRIQTVNLCPRQFQCDVVSDCTDKVFSTCGCNKPACQQRIQKSCFAGYKVGLNATTKDTLRNKLRQSVRSKNKLLCGTTPARNGTN